MAHICATFSRVWGQKAQTLCSRLRVVMCIAARTALWSYGLLRSTRHVLPAVYCTPNECHLPPITQTTLATLSSPPLPHSLPLPSEPLNPIRFLQSLLPPAHNDALATPLCTIICHRILWYVTAHSGIPLNNPCAAVRCCVLWHTTLCCCALPCATVCCRVLLSTAA